MGTWPCVVTTGMWHPPACCLLGPTRGTHCLRPTLCPLLSPAWAAAPSLGCSCLQEHRGLQGSVWAAGS